MNYCNKICVAKWTQKEFKGWKKYNLENPNEELLYLIIKIIRNTRKDKIYKSNIKILKFLIYHTKYVYKMYKKITKNLMFP